MALIMIAVALVHLWLGMEVGRYQMQLEAHARCYGRWEGPASQPEFRWNDRQRRRPIEIPVRRDRTT